jgi:hypothetical protein
MDYEESEDEGDDEGDGEENITDGEFLFQWLTLVDWVSETQRTDWETVYKMDIYTFFNMVCYVRWKIQHPERQIHYLTEIQANRKSGGARHYGKGF